MPYLIMAYAQGTGSVPSPFTTAGWTNKDTASYTIDNVCGMSFNDDGTKMYTLESLNSGQINEFTLSTAYDITSFAGYLSRGFGQNAWK